MAETLKRLYTDAPKDAAAQPEAAQETAQETAPEAAQETVLEATPEAASAPAPDAVASDTPAQPQEESGASRRRRGRKSE